MNEQMLEDLGKQLQIETLDYPTRVLLNETFHLLQQQSKRIAYLQGQLDGRVWNPSSWQQK